MRVLFLATSPSLEASTRYRLLQFFPALRAAGHEPTLSTFYTERKWTGRSTRIGSFANGMWNRAADLVRARQYDVIIVHRELLPHAWNHLAPLLARRAPIVFDFDDAVFMRSSQGTRWIARPASTRALVDAAELVFAGNEYLADYARARHSRVEVIPTVVDTCAYAPVARAPRDVPIVGWIGSPSTAQYLRPILPILDELARHHRFRLRIVGAGRAIRLANIEVESPPWRAEREEELFNDLDIGVYPLSDDRWALGKCGFKAIQYMACGVSSVVSPVGVVRDIVRDGVDGIWAPDPAAWREALAALIASPGERARMAIGARARAVSAYSLQVVAPRVVSGLAQVGRAESIQAGVETPGAVVRSHQKGR